MRRIEECFNCGETREIAAHGLCFTCYRQHERAARKPADVDLHNPGVRPEHKKLFRGFTSVMVGVSDLGVASKDVITIRRIIEPYLTPISKFLSRPEPEEEIRTVNSEQKLHYVHSSQESVEEGAGQKERTPKTVG